MFEAIAERFGIRKSLLKYGLQIVNTPLVPRSTYVEASNGTHSSVYRAAELSNQDVAEFLPAFDRRNKPHRVLLRGPPVSYNRTTCSRRLNEVA
jgi:hypothetical protein